jgi:site-specific DNA-methyltransferase (adenine-specific)
MIAPFFERGDVALFHGDARELLPLLGLRVDLVLTDVPYSPSTHDGARTNARGERATEGLRGKQLVDFKHFDEQTLLEFFDVVGRFAARWLVTTCDFRHAHALAERTPGSLRFVRRGVWVKTNPAPQLTGDRPGQGFEDVVVMHAASERRLVWNGGGRALTLRIAGEPVEAYEQQLAVDLRRAAELLDEDGAGDVGAIELPGVRKSNYPTEKPIALGRQLVKLFSAPGDVVLDPACGAGTFLRAARQLGRVAIGIDVDERALEVAARLIEAPPASDAAKPDELCELPVRRRSLLHERAGLPVDVEP